MEPNLETAGDSAMLATTAGVATVPDGALASQVITTYLLDQSDEFRQLSQLRQQGWDNPEGDKFFAQQRANADAANSTGSQQAKQSARFFFTMMQNIGRELHIATGAFNTTTLAGAEPKFLDMCMAPGGFLSAAMQFHPNAIATAYSLPVEAGGHEVLLPEHNNIKIKMLDITMLAVDLGADSIPEGHSDIANFLPKQFHEGEKFDIVFCDGQVLRTHERAAYREHCEARRLSVAQRALGLEHLRPGGTMVVLLHKLEAPDTVELLRMFRQFSSIQLFKPPRSHAKRSSFYLVASNIQVEHPEAVKAVEEWKHTWSAATFGSQDEYKQLVHKDISWAEDMLEEFGPVLVDIGKDIWGVQAQALARAPFIAGQSARPQSSGQWRRKY